MRAEDFLKEYSVKEKSRIRVEKAKQKALAETKRIDDEYWADKSEILRRKYKEANRLPMDHPFTLQYQKETGRELKNDFFPG